ncbi:type IV toxin-antitoxin system AbiEi family antitoxin [Rhodohalobacter sp.]|uniref:type IV toxin-antitoxin system AbiEi family antitoxin n=1 Tax=Rhodohalobacter sp. TaxID=1974210 RepID=UPI002ACF03B0|nr:type IV toxin-antitoxin system AbiEi family antitoxin [Rhodohalobacter sp.]MDZ7758073.1 type IV toxin-antitoxin system AbiEi family antitoxin [Rhodohalobacter sp.]
MDKNNIEQPLQLVRQHTGIDVEWVNNDQKKEGKTDGKLIFKTTANQQIERYAEVRKEIRKHNVPQLGELAKEIGPVMLVAEKLYPAIKEKLIEAGVDWLDGAGNIYLKEGDTIIWIDHHTTTPDKQIKNRAFTKTGLKVLFLILHDEVWLNRTYRDIAEAAGVAIGGIKYVLDGLKDHDFILAKNDKELKLKNREKLLDQWLIAFADELKPKITKGRYRFVNHDDMYKWNELQLPDETVWGGEPAADLITHNLKPKEFILYTNENRAELMKELKLAPDREGIVEVRTPYWNIDPEHQNVAPLLTIYTDLMLTGDPRNANIAKTLYEKA